MIRLYTLCFIFLSLSAYCQEKDSLNFWKKGGSFNLNFSQVGLKNWVGGGENSLSLTGLSTTFLTFDKDKRKWDSTLDIAFGILQQGTDRRLYKSEDKVILTSKGSRRIYKEHWSLSGLLDFRTQMAPGYEFGEDTTGERTRTLISRFMAPGFLVLTPGIEYHRGDDFYMVASPFAGKFTFVLDEELSNAGAFGVDPGQKVRAELGANFTAGYKKLLMENVTLNTRVMLFSSYESFGNIDVNWELQLLMKVNKYINAAFSSQLLYDDDIDVERDNGTTGPALQFKEVINIGLLYQFGDKQKK